MAGLSEELEEQLGFGSSGSRQIVTSPDDVTASKKFFMLPIRYGAEPRYKMAVPVNAESQS